MNAPAVLELPLDDALLKVLSSESRREILRLLRERRMTGAEMAARLDLGKPAVAEHLKKLQEAELIERFDDPERRWVYYGLSPRGRGILEPQRVRFYLVMAVAAVGLMVGVALTLGLMVLLQGPPGAGTLAGAGGDGAESALGGAGLPGVAAGSGLPGPAAPAAAATSSSAPPPPPAPKVDVVVGPSRPARPVGNVTPAGPSAEANALLIDPASVPKRRESQAEAASVVLVYRAQDVDAANRTIQVHLIPLNATALAAANLTEAVQGAEIVPDVGLVLVVPDATPLPEADNGTATITFHDPPAATDGNAGGDGVAGTAPDANATASAPPPAAAATPPASATPTAAPAAPSSAPAAQAATTAAPATAATVPASAPTAPAPAPAAAGGATAPAATASSSPSTSGAGLSGAGQQGAAGAAGLGPENGIQAQPEPAASGRAAPIPLVALLAAALMVSVYLPNRRR